MARLLVIAISVLVAFSFMDLASFVNGEEFYCGHEHNCYDVLSVNRDSTPAEIKRQFYKLSLLYHPDKNPDPEAAKNYTLISQAYDVLKDENTRSEYNDLIDNPEKYYRHYASYFSRKFLGPQENAWIVSACLLLFCTVCDRLYHQYRYNVMRDYLRSNRFIIQRVKQLRATKERNAEAKESGRSKKSGKKDRKAKFEEITDEELDSVVQISGRVGRAPRLTDLLVIRILRWPCSMSYALYWHVRWFVLFTLLKQPWGEQEREYSSRIALKQNLEEWASHSDEERKDLIRRELWVAENLQQYEAELAKSKSKSIASDIKKKLWNELDYEYAEEE